MKFNYSIFIVILFILSGCGAKNVVKPGGKSDSKYAPQNEASRNGIVKYLNDGSSYIVKSRREDAYKIMYQNCNGKYNIVNEKVGSKGGANRHASYSFPEYMYIEYKCL